MIHFSNVPVEDLKHFKVKYYSYEQFLTLRRKATLLNLLNLDSTFDLKSINANSISRRKE